MGCDRRQRAQRVVRAVFYRLRAGGQVYAVEKMLSTKTQPLHHNEMISRQKIR